MTIHVLGFPHTETTHEYLTCAYTQKAVKFCKMMSHEKVILYAGEKNDAPCAEHIPCITKDERIKWFGEWNPNQMPNVGWSATDPWWLLFNIRAIMAMMSRIEKGDIICLTTGGAQKPVADAYKGTAIAVESGVGYEGIVGEFHCAFESYAWMHTVYGLRQIKDGRNFDCVIPNYFDPDDFPHLNDGKGDYLLFVGRVTPRKGIEECVHIAKRAGMELLIAGPRDGAAQDQVKVHDANVEFLGPVGVQERAKLMAGAKALLAPTRYIEPFGGVAVEAMFCGTPVIATDHGAFTETVQNGLSGYRFRTLQEAAQAVKNTGKLTPTKIRDYALERYSLKAVAPLYDAWFARLNTLWQKGWFE